MTELLKFKSKLTSIKCLLYVRHNYFHASQIYTQNYMCKSFTKSLFQAYNI